MPDAERTASDVLLESMHRGGVEVVFANFGTDHAGIIESFARHEAGLLTNPVPRLVLCQHEGVAANAALGYAHFTGRAQVAMVHVDVGTLNLGAGLHNASRNRLPVFLFAGVAPVTEFGERKGGRDIPVHWIQEVYDQRGSVREYVKWEYELRTGCNTHHAVARALQMANAWPQGPVYMTAAREPLEEPAPANYDYPQIGLPGSAMPDDATLDLLVQRLRAAERPVVLTSSAGRRPGGLEALAAFAEAFVVPVVEVRPVHVNLPADHPLHLGYASHKYVQDADLILVIDCDVPWVPPEVQPRADATVVWLGEDPLGSHVPMRTFPSHHVLPADAGAALRALVARAGAHPSANPDGLAARRRALAAEHDAQRAQWREEGSRAGGLTAANVSALVAEIAGDTSIFINESVTSAPAVQRQLNRRRSNTYFGSAGSGLGLGLPAALGAKLARPDADVIALEGDAAYMFGVPAATHWSAQAYGAPFLTVILNNGRWNAVVDSTHRVHPGGVSVQSGVPQATFLQPPDLSKVVAVAGGVGMAVTTTDEAARAIAEGLSLVRRGTSVVIDCKLTE